MAKLDVKQIIFDLAGYEKSLCGFGGLTEEDKQWFNEELGFDGGFENDDVFGLSVQDISELVFEFIDHCEEVK